MSGLKDRWRLLWAKRHSPEVWLLASNLIARALGFVVSLLVSRLLGAQALGVYSGLLVTGASPTTPMSAALSNNATMLAVRYARKVPLLDLLKAHGHALLASALLAGLGCWLMLHSSTLLESDGLVAPRVVVCVAAVLVLGQLLSQVGLGLCHGADLSRQASQAVFALTAVAVLTAYPVLKCFGLAGILTQAALVMVLPGLGLVWWFLRLRASHPSPQPSVDDQHALLGEIRRSSAQALPNVLATIVNNSTNWVSCIYLTERYHGHGGLGLIAIGLQWAALMQLPVSSWGGRIMRDLASAKQVSPSAFRREIGVQVRKALAVSVLASIGVAAMSMWVADLYKVDRQFIVELFAVNAVASTLAAVNVVYEKVFFCLGSQRPWLLISVGAYVAQLAVTMLIIQQSLLAVPVGNLTAIMVVLLVVSGYLAKVLKS